MQARDRNGGAKEGIVEEEEEYLGNIEDEEDEEDAAGLDAEPDEEAEGSLDELVAKPEEAAGEEEEEDEEAILSLDRDDRLETLSVKVEPKKETEFVCQNCYLVKPIRSQLADKKRMFCRDCA